MHKTSSSRPRNLRNVIEVCNIFILLLLLQKILILIHSFILAILFLYSLYTFIILFFLCFLSATIGEDVEDISSLVLARKDINGPSSPLSISIKVVNDDVVEIEECITVTISIGSTRFNNSLITISNDPAVYCIRDDDRELDIKSKKMGVGETVGVQ